MTLLELKKLFRKQSGRTDLVQANGSDGSNVSTHGLSATLLINEGKNFLDEFFPQSPKARKWYKRDITSGQVLLRFYETRAIEQVWVADADGKQQLTYKSLEWIRTQYNVEKADVVGGTPKFWTRADADLAPQQAALTSADYTAQFTYDADDLMFSDEVASGKKLADYSGVLFYPPSSSTLTMSLFGLFGEADLVEDEDVNFWSQRYPLTLIYAACYMLEVFYRNKEGAADWLEAIQRSLSGMDNNEVHFASQGQQIAG